MPKPQIADVPARLFQYDAALTEIEHRLAASMEEGEDISPEAVELLTSFAEEGKRNVDLTARWLQEITDKIAYLKAEEKTLAEARKTGENALAQVKAALGVHLDQKRALLVAGGAEDNDKLKPKIEGEASSIWVQAAGTPSLVIAEDAEIPDGFKCREMRLQVDVDLEQSAVDALIEFLGGFEIEYKYDPESEPIINTKNLRAAIESGVEIEGVKLEKSRGLRWSKPRALKLAEPKEGEE